MTSLATRRSIEKIKTLRSRLGIMLRLEEIRHGTHIVVCVRLGARESLTLVTTFGVSLLVLTFELSCFSVCDMRAHGVRES
jgi:hypothetical protein